MSQDSDSLLQWNEAIKRRWKKSYYGRGRWVLGLLFCLPFLPKNVLVIHSSWISESENLTPLLSVQVSSVLDPILMSCAQIQTLKTWPWNLQQGLQSLCSGSTTLAKFSLQNNWALLHRRKCLGCRTAQLLWRQGGNVSLKFLFCFVFCSFQAESKNKPGAPSSKTSASHFAAEIQHCSLMPDLGGSAAVCVEGSNLIFCSSLILQSLCSLLLLRI